MTKKVFMCLLMLVLLLPFMTIKAETFAKVKTLNVDTSNGKIEVDGTTEDGCLAVTIFVYDETETDLVALQTTSVDSSNRYKDTIEVDNNNYVVKVVNYDGGDYVSKRITLSNATSKDSPNPETHDSGIKSSLILLIVGVLGMIGSRYLYKKKVTNN